MDLFGALERSKQEEFWAQYLHIIENELASDPVKATFVAFDRFKEKYRHDLTYDEHWGYLGQEVEEPTVCPACGDCQVNVIYAGFSMQVCAAEKCRTATGLFSWVPLIYFNGWLFPYFGSYLKGLWDWITMDMDTDD